jgi:hypothetical protein
MGTDARLFGDQCRIDVCDLKTSFPNQLGCVREKKAAVGIAPGWVGWGEVLADVAEGGRTEERIDDRVQEHIGVGVTGQTRGMGDFDATENETSSHFELVDVIANTGADRHPITP